MEELMESCLRLFVLLGKLGKWEKMKAVGKQLESVLGMRAEATHPLDRALQKILYLMSYEEKELVPSGSEEDNKIKEALSAIQESLFDEKTISASSETVSKLCLSALFTVELPGSKHLAHKAFLAKALKNASMLGVSAPETFLVSSFEEFLEIVSRNAVDQPASCWYLKDPMVQRGQGVDVVLTRTLLEEGPEKERIALKFEKKKSVSPSDPSFCLQPAVEPLHLLDGRKYGLRVHLMVVFVNRTALLGKDISNEEEKRKEKYDRFVFVANESVLTKCGAVYDPEDTSALSQITCTSVQRSLEGYDRSKVKGPASEMIGPFYQNTIFPKIVDSLGRLIGSIGPHLLFQSLPEDYESLEGPVIGWQMYGCDFLVRQNGEPCLIEINSCPQLGDPQSMPQLRSSVALPLINGIPFLLYEALSLSLNPQPVSSPSSSSLPVPIFSGDLSFWTRAI